MMVFIEYFTFLSTDSMLKINFNIERKDLLKYAV